MIELGDLDTELLMHAFNKRIAGQEETKRLLSAAVTMHYKIQWINEETCLTSGAVKYTSGNIIIYGPSGCGKTEFFRVLRDELNVPIEVIDSTAVSGAGYKGNTLIDLMGEYVRKYEDMADKGIIIFDEFDKLLDLAAKEGNAGEYAKGFLNEFLKFSEGTMVHTEYGDLDTSDLMMVFVGSFRSLLKEKNRDASCLGFFTNKEVKETAGGRLSTEDFISYGVSPEFMGRVNLICEVKALTKNDYKDILTYSTNSPLVKYEKIFNFSNNKLTFTHAAINYLAEEATKMNLGARGLTKLLEPYMLTLLANLGNKKDLSITVTDKCLKNRKMPLCKAKAVVR